MIGGQRGDHRHTGQHALERKHGLDAFTGEQHPCFCGGRLGGGPRAGGEAHAVAEQMAERPARIGERRLVGPLAVEPGAVNAGDAAARIGHGSDESRPRLAGRVGVGPIRERGVKAQRRPVEIPADAARAERR
jgi:hypothetical protein